MRALVPRIQGLRKIFRVSRLRIGDSCVSSTFGRIFGGIAIHFWRGTFLGQNLEIIYNRPHDNDSEELIVIIVVGTFFVGTKFSKNLKNT